MLALRQDLTLSMAEAEADGTPSWILHDPSQNRFFRLGPVEIEFLRAETADPAGLADIATTRLGRTISTTAATEFLGFLRKNNLLQASGEAERKRLLEARAAGKPGMLSWLVKNYLSIRIPLVRPDRFLDVTVSYLSWWFDPRLKWIMAGLGFIGLIMVGLRWDEFVATAVDYFTPRGLAAYAITIALIKIVHELGHAYTVKRYGGRVPAMGVSFIIFWPVLYTDANDAWTFGRRARVEVDAAGMKAELAIAVLALLLWLALPDGTLRGLAFLACTTSLVLTFLVNLNPLMRFDGYYLLSDALGIENLQERSTAQLRWHLRKWLLGLNTVAAEKPSFALALYAAAAWFYRLMLTLGIAAFIYAFFFKLLGLALFVLQIWTAVLRPVWREIVSLRELWSEIRHSPRFAVSAGCLAAFLLAGLLPMQMPLSFPVQLHVARSTPIYTMIAGQVMGVRHIEAKSVAAEEAVLVVQSPDLAFELQQVEASIRTLNWQMETQSVDAPWLKQSLVLEASLRSTLERRVSLHQRVAKETVAVQTAGTLVDSARDLQAGQWVGEGEFVGRVIGTAWEAEGFVEEGDLAGLAEGATGYFFFADGMRDRQAIRVVEISPGPTKDMGPSPLLSIFGGPLQARQAPSGSDAYPLAGTYYKIRLATEATPEGDFPQQLVGSAVLFPERPGFFIRLTRTVVQMFRREISF